MRKRLSSDPGQAHFVCASAGNHAQGLAFACAHFGVRGTIFMPVTTPAQKIDKTRVFGGGGGEGGEKRGGGGRNNVEIRLVGDFLRRNALAAAKAFCADAGAHFLAALRHPHVIEGQASVAVEMVQELGRPPDILVLPVGGGGLRRG